MDTNNLVEKFIKFESENLLFHRFYHNFNYWGYIRFEVYSKIFQIQNQTSPITLDKKKNLKTLFKLSCNIIHSFIKQPRKKQPIIIIQHPRKQLVDKYNQDIYTNFLAEKYNKNSVIIDNHTPLYSPNQKYVYYKDDQTIVWRLIYKFLSSRVIEEDKYITKLQIEIENTFNIFLPQNYLVDLVYNRYLLYKAYYKCYSKLINRVQPKCIIEVVYYNFPNMVLNEIAQKYDIATIELQHGTMGKNHLAYNYLIRNTKYKQLPKYIFLFSEYWKNTTRLPLSNNYIKITGFPFFETQKALFYQDKTSQKKQNIIFISQTTIGMKLSKFAAELIDIIDTDKYTISYKFHPAEYDNWANRMPWLYEKRNNINIIDNKNVGLYQLFASSSIQVGVYSTGIYEGLGFNLRTYIIRLPGWEGMEPLIKNHFATLIEKPHELANILGQENSTSNIESITFWKTRAKENIINEINNIIS